METKNIRDIFVMTFTQEFITESTNTETKIDRQDLV